MTPRLKHYRPLPDYDRLAATWLAEYERSNYDHGLASAVLRRTHALIERPFGPETAFAQVLEVGAGTLVHLRAVRHRFERYIASDNDQAVLDSVKHHQLPKGVELMLLNGTGLPFPNDSFDRVIATHVLEHLPLPHLAIEEWVRVVKPGGVISIVLPCDPGWAWRIGRHFGPRQRSEDAGLPYDYYMAREHVNSIFNLRELLTYHLPNNEITWWPLRIPIPDFNLIFAGNFYV